MTYLPFDQPQQANQPSCAARRLQSSATHTMVGLRSSLLCRAMATPRGPRLARSESARTSLSFAQLHGRAHRLLRSLPPRADEVETPQRASLAGDRARRVRAGKLRWIVSRLPVVGEQAGGVCARPRRGCSRLPAPARAAGPARSAHAAQRSQQAISIGLQRRERMLAACSGCCNMPQHSCLACLRAIQHRLVVCRPRSGGLPPRTRRSRACWALCTHQWHLPARWTGTHRLMPAPRSRRCWSWPTAWTTW